MFIHVCVDIHVHVHVCGNVYSTLAKHVHVREAKWSWAVEAGVKFLSHWGCCVLCVLCFYGSAPFFGLHLFLCSAMYTWSFMYMYMYMYVILFGFCTSLGRRSSTTSWQGVWLRILNLVPLLQNCSSTRSSDQSLITNHYGHFIRSQEKYVSNLAVPDPMCCASDRSRDRAAYVSLHFYNLVHTCTLLSLRSISQEVKSEVVEVVEELAEDADLTKQEEHTVSQDFQL